MGSIKEEIFRTVGEMVAKAVRTEMLAIRAAFPETALPPAGGGADPFSRRPPAAGRARIGGGAGGGEEGLGAEAVRESPSEVALAKARIQVRMESG